MSSTRWLSKSIREKTCQLAVVTCTAIWLLMTLPSFAAVTSTGEVNPVPPSGGGTVATLTVGNTDFGQVSIGAGTPLVVSNEARFGQGATGIGILIASGFNSNFDVGGLLVVGERGAGSIQTSNLVRLTSSADAILGEHPGSSGEVRVSQLGTSWRHGGALSVGKAGRGVILLTGGGRLTPAATVQGAASTILGEASTGFGRVTVTGLHSLWQPFDSVQSAGQSLIIGLAGQGELEIVAEGRVISASTQDTVLGHSANSEGLVTVDGQGSLWSLEADLIAGRAGYAVMNITGGGRVRFTNDDLVMAEQTSGTANLRVRGDGSLLENVNQLIIGNSGTASLQASDRARISGSSGTIGANQGSVGNAIIEGVGSTWAQSGGLTVGGSGHGTLTISQGATVSSSTGTIGSGSTGNGQVSVRGTSSQWAQSGTLTVAQSGFGNLFVSDGGRVISGNGRLGSSAAAVANVSVEGMGSYWDVNGTLIVSNPGSAVLTIAHQGLVSVTGSATQDNVVIGSGGRLQLAGGQMNVHGGANPAQFVSLNNSGVLQGSGLVDIYDPDEGAQVFRGRLNNLSSGQIRTVTGNQLTLDANVFNSGLMHANGGEIEVRGSVTNTGSIDASAAVLRFGSLINQGGAQLAAVGGLVNVFGPTSNLTGAQIVAGAGTQLVFHDPLLNQGQLVVLPGATVLTLSNLGLASPSELDISLGGLTDFGQVHAATDVTLVGGLTVRLANQFIPRLGDTFQIITTGGSRTGTFSSTNLPPLANGLGWNVSYLPNNVLLSVVGGISADFNNDGLLNCLDIDLLVDAVATQSGALQFDLTGDGQLNSADVDQWLGIAGQTNLPSGNPYLHGDANLDGHVNLADFSIWNAHKFTSTARWCAGDFTADGRIDGSDFGKWNRNKGQSSMIIPEPMGLLLCWLVGLPQVLRGRVRSGSCRSA